MNATEQAVLNPWQKRETFPNVEKKNIIISMLALFFSAVTLAWGEASEVFLPFLFLYVVLVARKPSAVLLILATAVAASLFSLHLEGAAILLALVVGVCSFAWLTSVLRYFFVAPLLLCAAFGLAWGMTGNALNALLAFALLPAGLLLYFATVSAQRRTTAICFAEGGLLISLVTIAAVILYRTYGTLEIAKIAEYADGGIAYYAQTFSDLLGKLSEQIYETAIAQGQSASAAQALRDNWLAMFSVTNMQAMISMLFGLIPAFACMVCGTVAFEAQLLLNLSYRNCGWKQVLTADACIFTMSLPASILYLISFLCTLFLGGTSLFATLMQNICLILLPGLCVLGIGSIIAYVRGTRGGARIFVILLFAGLICCAGFSSLYFLALWGANATVMELLRRKMLQKMKESGFGNDHGDDGDDL